MGEPFANEPGDRSIVQPVTPALSSEITGGIHTTEVAAIKPVDFRQRAAELARRVSQTQAVGVEPVVSEPRAAHAPVPTARPRSARPLARKRPTRDQLEESDVLDNEDIQSDVDADERQPILGGELGSALDMYFSRIGRYPLLLAEEEVTLAKSVEAGLFAEHLLKQIVERALLPEALPHGATIEELQRLQARGKSDHELFINSNLRLVVKIAKGYWISTSSLSLGDLIQEGNVGLGSAINKFDYTKGFKFSTYGMWWIKQSIRRAISDKSRMIRVPSKIHDQIYKFRKDINERSQQLGRELTDGEITEVTERSPAEVAWLLRIDKDPVSTDRLVGNGSDTHFSEFIADADSVQATDVVLEQERVDVMDSWMRSVLTAREYDILRLRHGMSGQAPMTLIQIANSPDFDVSRERVRQIEVSAMKKLRAGLNPELTELLRGK